MKKRFKGFFKYENGEILISKDRVNYVKAPPDVARMLKAKLKDEIQKMH